MKYSIEKEWLERRYAVDFATVDVIAGEVGCGVPNIRRLLKKWGIKRGHVVQAMGLTPVWNKGLTKESDPRLKRISESRAGEGNPMFGREAWNKGLTKEDDPRLMSVSEALTGREVSLETRRKQSEAKVGLCGESANNWQGGSTYSNGYGVTRSTINGVRNYAHRHVAEMFIGRPLLSSEHVHHIDRNKMNNDPGNLIVIETEDHNRLHRAIEVGYESPEAQRNWLRENSIRYQEVRVED